MSATLKIGTKRALLMAAVWLIGALPTWAQEVRLHLSADSVTVGERFYLSLVAEHSFMAEASFPEIPPDTARTDSATGTGLPFGEIQLRFGDVEVLGRTLYEGRYGGGQAGVRMDSVVYEVTTFALDSARVPPIPIGFTAGEDTFTVATPAATIAVVSLVPADAEGLRPLAPLAEFPRPLWPYVLLGLAILVMLVTLYYWWRERRQEPQRHLGPTPPPVPAFDVAMDRLRTLEQTSDLTNPAEIKPFYVELADLLRTYLEARLGVRALESTTRELTRELERRAAHDRFPPEAAKHVYGVLGLADLVKFADLKPPRSQHEQALAETRELLELVEHDVAEREQRLAAEQAAAQAPEPEPEPA